MKKFIKVMKALSDPTRVKIVKMLERRILCVCEIRAVLEVAQSTVSKHLKILEEAGILTSFREGIWVNYRIDPQNEYAEKLLSLIGGYLNEEEEIKKTIEKMEHIYRQDILKGET